MLHLKIFDTVIWFKFYLQFIFELKALFLVYAYYVSLKINEFCSLFGPKLNKFTFLFAVILNIKKEKFSEIGMKQ